MAILIKATGEQIAIQPASGKLFTLDELQKLVGGFIEIQPLNDNRLIILDEHGKINDKPVNHVATALYNARFGRIIDPIVGDVVIATYGEEVD